MNLVKITARVLSISAPQIRGTYEFRTLVLDDTSEWNGKSYPNVLSIDFGSRVMNMLDGVAVGQVVTAEAFVRGREYNGKYYHNLDGRSVYPSVPAVMQPAAPQPAPTPQPQAPMFPANAFGTPPPPAYGTPKANDLPF